MAIYDQLIQVLAEHPGGLNTLEILAEAKKRHGNVLTDIAMISRNLHGLDTKQGVVERLNGQKDRRYRLTPKGFERAKRDGLMPAGVDPSASQLPFSERSIGDIPDCGTIDDKSSFGTTEAVLSKSVLKRHSALNDGKVDRLIEQMQAIRLKLDAIMARDDSVRELPPVCIMQKQEKLRLLSTLADLSMGSETGALLLSIKGDLERMPGHAE